MKTLHYIGPLLLSLTLLFQARGQNYTYSQLTQDKGLADNFVFSALMDRQGYMWFGTNEGLSRWDGTSMKNFRPDVNDSLSLSSMVIFDLAEDAEGKLWIAILGGGLNCFDPVTETFKAYRANPAQQGTVSGDNVVSVYIDQQQRLWAGTFNEGVNLYEKENNRFRHFHLNSNFNSGEEAWKRNSVFDMTDDASNDNLLWMAGNDGLYSLEKSTGKIGRYYSPAPNSAGLSIQTLWMDQPDSLWLGTYSGGLVHFNTSDKSWTYHTPKPQFWLQRDANHNIIKGIARKSDHELWISSPDVGFGIFNVQTHQFSFFRHQSDDPFSILDNSANMVYLDPEKRIWVMHPQRGVSFYNPGVQFFNFHSVDIGQCRTFIVSGIADFAYDPNQDMIYMAGSACDGFFVLNRQKEVVKRVPLKEHEGASQIYYSILVDHRGQVWVGGSHSKGNEVDLFNRPSLAIYNRDENWLEPFEHPQLNEIPLQQSTIHHIIEDTQNRIWIATDFAGLVMINPQRDSIFSFSPLNDEKGQAIPVSIARLLEDSRGQIWLATFEQGLFIFDPSAKSFTHFQAAPAGNHLIGNHLTHLLEDSRGQIWIGTVGKGIQVLDPLAPDQRPFKWYSYNENLPSGTIDKMLLDADSNIWITTRKGLARFDELQGKFIAYGLKEGLNQTFFYRHGLQQMPWGEIFIGQEKGFYSFHPDSMNRHHKNPKLVFTEFKISDVPQKFGKNLNYLDKIVLGHNQNFFSIGFAMIDFDFPEKIRYAYQLEGLDKDWIQVSSNRNYSNYTKVRPGNYTFRLKSLNGKRPAGNEEIQLKIQILPPWWASWWAYFLYAAFAFASLYTLYRQRLNQKLAKAEARRLKELDEFKTRLFTNLSHEFRTPLSLILGPVNRALKKTAPLNRKSLLLIRKNSQQLLKLINELLSLSKLDEGKLKPNYVQGDIIPFIKYIIDGFSMSAREKKVQLQFHTAVPSLTMDYDRDKLLAIVSNLLSNALKFTPSNGTVKIEINQSDRLEIRVSDTGIGISAEALPHVFDRFYQADASPTRKEGGTGIGLALTKELVELLDGQIEAESTKGKGTIFIVWLPIHLSAPREKTTKIQALEPYLSEFTTVSKVVKKDTATPSKAKLIALIIEDNPDTAQFVASCLDNQYQSFFAQNGNEGIKKAFQTIPDIIICDLMMPEKDGFEVCKILKNDQRTSHIPVILLTARADIPSRLSGLEKGADAYLTKPFNEQELRIRISHLLDLRRKLREYYSSQMTLSDLEKAQDVVPEMEVELDNDFLKKLRQIVEENLTEPDLSVPDLAKGIGMSHSQMHRKLTALTGKSAVKFIRSIRLYKARSILRNRQLTISEVAYDTGFSDPAYFSRAFTKEFGLSPSQYRESI